MCNLGKTSPLKSGESSENPEEKIASNPIASVAVMVFFGPEKERDIEKQQSPCHKRSPAKGFWQKSGETKVTEAVRKSDQKNDPK